MDQITFQIVDAETMTEIESTLTLADAVNTVKRFEQHDLETGIYEPDYYRIVRKWQVGHRRYRAEYKGDGLLVNVVRSIKR